MKVFGIIGLVFLWLGLTATPLAAQKKSDVVVAADGSGDVKTIGEAIARVPANNQKRFVIFIKSDSYREQINIPANKPFISIIGEKAETTKLTFNIANKDVGSTSAAFTFYVGGHDFYAENITFENSFGTGSQAVAVLSDADRAIFKNCRFLAWQDTLYARRGRQFFKDCYIEGSVDFIFGQATAVFETCQIHSKTDGYIAAPMRFSADEKSGLIFVKCKLTAENAVKSVFLGRPWRDYGRTVFLETEMGAHINPEGWNHWLTEREKTAYFAEYKSTGKGANAAARVKWSNQLTEIEAKSFYAETFLKGDDGWNPKGGYSVINEKTPADFQLITWSDVFRQIPLWYPTDEAVTIANQILFYQKDNGGWEKNIDMTLMLTKAERDKLSGEKSDISETTIDNRTTYTQLAYLAKIITAKNFEHHKTAFFKGFDYLLASQYENGGFPQFFPLKKGYYTHITYNDDAMIGVLNFLKDIAEKKPDYLFVDEERRLKAEKAVSKGIEAILKTQVKVGGKLTAWCAQHDEKTLAPAAARAFEPVSLSGYESVGIVRFLMSIEKPNREIVDSIEAAVSWFEKSEVKGIKIISKPSKIAPKNYERVAVKDANAPTLWARFYDIKTNRPVFMGRDSIAKTNFNEIEIERRNGYSYYTDAPGKLLNVDYPKWKTEIKK